jgi:hypothetical protein
MHSYRRNPPLQLSIQRTPKRHRTGHNCSCVKVVCCSSHMGPSFNILLLVYLRPSRLYPSSHFLLHPFIHVLFHYELLSRPPLSNIYCLSISFSLFIPPAARWLS